MSNSSNNKKYLIIIDFSYNPKYLIMSDSSWDTK